jgi:glutathione S-transferase
MLLCSPASPYSSKVRIAALACGFPLEEKFVSTVDEPIFLLEANPLGKIPTLLLGDGKALFDSSVIVRYLDQQAGGLFGSNNETLIANAQLEALGDGINDAALAIIYEKRFRPIEAIYQPWLEKQWRKIKRALTSLDGCLPPLEKSPGIGAISLRVALAYLSLRFCGEWEQGHSNLINWAKAFDEAFPALSSALPADRPA